MHYYTMFWAMGSQIQIWLDTEADGEAILKQTPAWFEEIEACLSRFRSESELSRLNARAGKAIEVSDVLFIVARAAQQAARITGGLYNPLVLRAMEAAGYDRDFQQIKNNDNGTIRTPENHTDIYPVPDWQTMRLDSQAQTVQLPAGAGFDAGGIGKGWTAQYVARRLEQYGTCLVDAGGDLVAHGTWTAGVADPFHEGQLVARVKLHHLTMATSGIDYRRWQGGHHLINPATGRPAQTDVLTATVIHPKATTAEAFAKALLLQGSEKGLQWINQQPEAAALLVCTDGGVLATQQFLSFIV